MDKESSNRDLVSSRLAVVGRLTGHVVHDVNNALSPLVGKLQILRMKATVDPEMLNRDLEIMENDSISASRRLQVLSQLSREAPVVEPPKPLVISDCIREMEFLVGHHLERRGIAVELNLESTMPAALSSGIDTKLMIGGFMITALSVSPSGGRFIINGSHDNADGISLDLIVEVVENKLVIPGELSRLIHGVSHHTDVQTDGADTGRITIRFRRA